MYKLLSVKNSELLKFHYNLLNSKKIVKLSDSTELIRGYELRGGLVTNLIVNKERVRAIKSDDIWILDNEKKTTISIKHKTMNGMSINVPIKSTVKTLRRFSGMDQINISDKLDYLILERWNDIKFQIIENAIGKRISNSELKSIQNEVEKRRSYLYIARRIDLSAAGSHALAFYSSKNAAPSKLLWSLKASKKISKIYALYFNSIINLIQILILRAETRGAFIGLPKNILNDFKIINPKKLSKKEVTRILTIFNEVKNNKLPSLLDQLVQKDPTKIKIDKMWLEILGYKGDKEKILYKIYDLVANEILLLKNIMKEGKNR